MNNENVIQDAITQLETLREMLELTVNSDNFETKDLQNIAVRLNLLRTSIEETVNLEFSC